MFVPPLPCAGEKKQVLGSGVCYGAAAYYRAKVDVALFSCRGEALGGAVRVPDLHSGLAPEKAAAGLCL